jgi:hypothetical protein
MALNAYINFNETNIESAQLRGNVVTRASALGYKPRSKIASKAVVNITVNNPIGVSNTLILPKGTRFTTTINNTEYPFVTNQSYSSSKSLDGKFRFTNIEIVQGVLKDTYFVYDDRDTYPVFVIPDYNIDTNTLLITVKEHDSALNSVVYTRYTSLREINIDSQIYFIDENYDGLFQISFGDDVMGKKLENNNVIHAQYISTKGLEVNGAKTFSISDAIGGNNDITLSVVAISASGLDREDIETIRFNSKRLFTAQDRCVTETDYLAIISNQFDDIETITVYGGENLPTPEYGKTYISIKPYLRDNLTLIEKDEIINRILKPKQVGTITPVIVNPDYTNISLKIDYKYNSNNTSLSILDLNNLIYAVVMNYNNTVLQKFSGVFRYSNLLTLIDASNPSITSNVVSSLMYKIITPVNNNKNYFELSFTNASFDTNSTEFTVSSTPIVINGETYFLGDKPTNDIDKRQLFLYRKVNNEILTLLTDVGYLIKSRGFIVLKNFTPDVTDEIRVYLRPGSLDLNPKFNQLLRIGSDEISTIGEIDAVAVGGGGLGSISYQTTPITGFS